MLQVIRDLVGSGIVPVIAPIGVDGSGRTYNCNADTAAGAIASALNAYRLLLLTDVAGVLDKDKNLLQELDSVQASFQPELSVKPQWCGRSSY